MSSNNSSSTDNGCVVLIGLVIALFIGIWVINIAVALISAAMPFIIGIIGLALLYVIGSVIYTSSNQESIERETRKTFERNINCPICGARGVVSWLNYTGVNYLSFGQEHNVKCSTCQRDFTLKVDGSNYDIKEK